jgi:hypothetical protein
MPISLVSQYGSKPPGLKNLITELHNILFDHFGKAFIPYEIEQVHGTIIGMETLLIEGQLFSKWCVENESWHKPIDTELLRDFLDKRIESFTIKIGGYKEDEEYGFRSRGQIPFERSFSIQSNRAVINGWPIRKAGEVAHHSDSLLYLRNEFKAFNLCHKWNIDGYQDNDFFLVLGKINQVDVNPERLQISGRYIRSYLSDHETCFKIGPDSLSLVEYENPELPTGTTRILNLKKLDWNQILNP